MDAIDILLVDHLIQNIDRHAFYFEPTLYSSLLLMDNGKGFVLKQNRFCDRFVLIPHAQLYIKVT